MGTRINMPLHRLNCPHCRFVVRSRFAWMARRKLRAHREGVHFGWLKGK